MNLNGFVLDKLNGMVELRKEIDRLAEKRYPISEKISRDSREETMNRIVWFALLDYELAMKKELEIEKKVSEKNTHR